jgi:FdrA protein
VKHLEIRAGVYRDSVALMRVSLALTGTSGVRQALVAMATPINLELLSDMDIDAPELAGPNDLLVAVVADDESALSAALRQLERELSGATPATSLSTSDGVRPRTTASAARHVEGGIALVSTPGSHAFVEAMDALQAGLSVMVFSDNVPVTQEVRLKRHAVEHGLLVMGPDCGTAVVAGVGLGFANVVRPGPVGLVAASGTGAQHAMALLAAAGVGVSHCLGVGGRDLSELVGGLSTHAALDALAADPSTELILVLGKPGSARVAEEVRSHAARLATPTVVAPLGDGAPDLTTVVEQVLMRLGVPVPVWPSWSPPPSRDWSPAAEGEAGWLRGLYGGGTLCVEAQVVAATVLGPVRSNVPLRPEWTVSEREPWVGLVDDESPGHVLLDLGADEYTIGRPHPMLDPAARLPLLEREAADPHVRAILLDVVLGHGSHHDPASVLAPAIASSLGRAEPLSIVVTLVGAAEDPQDLARQAAALREAGAWVFASNASAARHAAALAGGALAGAPTPAATASDTASATGRAS